MILGDGVDATEKRAEFRCPERSQSGVVEGDAGAALGHAVDDFDGDGALLPIPTQVVIIDVKVTFPRVPVAGAVGDVGDPRGRRVHRGRGFQRGAGVVERDDAASHIRLGGERGTRC